MFICFFTAFLLQDVFGNLPETTLSVHAIQKTELWELDMSFVGRLLDADDLLARKFFR